MNRRQLLSLSGAAATAAVAGGLLPRPATAAPDKPADSTRALMKLGTFAQSVTDNSMKALRRWGIENIYARAPIADPDRIYPTVDELSQMREIANRNGVSIDMLRPHNLAMSMIDQEEHPAIMLGQSPQRERDIEGLQETVRNCARVGIPAMRYTLSIVGNTRTGFIPGRGDSTYKYAKMADYDMDKPCTKAGHLSEEEYWEPITWFLNQMIPVANEYKVRLLSHMEDAMVPPGYQCLNPVTNTVEGAKKFVSIQESPYHGLLFCVGTFAEMLLNPQEDFYDVLRYFGERKKIFMVDFRNIRGNREEFTEVFPDEGDIDMYRVMQILKDVGYDGMVCPDHQPLNPDGPDQVNAFQYGYIRGLIQAVDRPT